GQTVVIAGAGGNGNGPLVANISARTATTITLTGLDGRSCLATATVAAATVTLFTRDSRIIVRGGTWALGTNAPSPFPAILMYHVDGVHIDIDRYTAAATSRGVGLGDVSDYWVRIK